MVETSAETKGTSSRLLENVLLNILLFATVSEHFRDRDDTSHSRTERGTDLTRVDVLVQLVRIGDTGHHEGFGDRDEGPERSAVDLGGDVVGDTERLVRPARRNLTRDETIESDRLRDLDLRALLELDKVLAAVVRVDVDHLAVFALEAARILLGSLDGLEVVLEFDLLNETLLLGVVATEELRFYGEDEQIRQ